MVSQFKQKINEMYLRNIRCVIVLERVYQHNNTFIKICNDCNERETVEYKKQFLSVFSHSLTHQNTVRNQTRCTTCNKPTVQREIVRAASNHLYMLIGYIWALNRTYLHQSPHGPKIKEIILEPLKFKTI